MISVINKQFIKAAQNNQLDELKNLLSQGANIHINNSEALREAAYYGYFEIVKILIERGANIHSGDDYALRFSARNGHLEIVKFLVTHGASIHANDAHALRTAAFHSHLEIVKFLVAQGANIHARDDEALKESARWGRDDVWQVLSAFIREEELLVAASGSTSASTWVCGMLALPAVVSVALVVASGSIRVAPPLGVAQTQRLSTIKPQRSKV